MNYSETLYDAANKKDWEKVRGLLEIIQTAEAPENLPAAYGGRNALYFALISGEFAIASRLYELGMRLDCPLQNCTESDSENSSASGIRILQFLSHESAYGRNYFFNKKRSLAECCRMALFCQAESLLDKASPEELAEALVVLPESLIREKSVEVFENFLDKLLFHGAAVILKRRSPEEFRGLSETFRQIMAWPSPIAVDRPDRLNVISEKILRAANEDALK